MSEQVATARVHLRDLADMPNDMVAMTAAANDLDHRQFSVWNRLRVHLYLYGELPSHPKALAKLGGVGLASFERMVPALERHFDPDEHGRWTDHHIIRSRGSRIVIPAQEPRKVDPELSRKRKISGRAGGLETQRQVREGLHLVSSQSDFASSDEAKSAKQNGSFATSTPEDREANASRGESLSVCLVDSESKNSEQTDKQTDDLRERGGDELKANVEAKLPPAVEANAPKGMGDDYMVAALVKAGEGKFDAVHASGRLSIFREWLTEGVSFELDIIPSVGEFARTNKVFKHCGNSAVREMAFARRDHRLKARATSPPNVLTFADPVLSKLANALTDRIGADATASWFRDMSIARTEADCLTLAFPKTFTRKHVEANFELQVRAAARTVDARFAKVLFTVAAAPTAGSKGVGGTDGSLPPPAG